MMVTYFLGPPCVTKYTRRYAPIMFIYFYSITHTCKRTNRDQNHDFGFNSTKVRRGNATKSWKLAAILDFGGHFDFFYLTAWHSDQNCFHKVEMTEYLGTPVSIVSAHLWFNTWSFLIVFHAFLQGVVLSFVVQICIRMAYAWNRPSMVSQNTYMHTYIHTKIYYIVIL